jgi:L-ascorbate metabolism protein UlaG (beta-lactamase superfamily)
MRGETKHGVRVRGIGVLAALVVSPFGLAQPAGTVKITPLGARTGEYCARDRALIFEDPTGIRILYDPGITVAGGLDQRLGEVHVILVSHNYFDHIGYQKLTQDPDAPGAICGTALQTTLSALQNAQTGNTNTAEIAVAKNSAVLVNANMAEFLLGKIQNIRGYAQSCFPARIEGSGPNELVVPTLGPCTGGLAFGSSRTVTFSSGAPGVRINMVQALHSDGVFNPSLLLKSSLNGNMAEDHLTAYGGLANGYVLTFTNGLKIYLSGDTGPMSDMAIIRDLYHPRLAVVNMDGVNVMGPEEAAYTMKQLVQPAAVIVSHAEEPVTTNGRVNPFTRTAQFIDLMGRPVYVPLSGKTMEFDGNGNCVACQGQTTPADNAPSRR